MPWCKEGTDVCQISDEGDRIGYAMDFEGFDWDEEKRWSNIEKHGIDFVAVPPIFTHPYIVRKDKRQDYGEVRMIILGTINREVCSVTYTVRQGICRFISARRANDREKKIYQEKSSTKTQEQTD